MNPNKKPNGWILCPSKSFPGKFYYFNVANGETAWSLNEAEKKLLKYPPIQKIGNSHSYPEPSSPPVNGTPLISKPTQTNIYPQDLTRSYPNRNISNLSSFLVQPPVFGQANYHRPNPVQIQVPMVIGSDYQNTPQVLMILMNQSANNQFAIQGPKASVRSPTMDPDRELFIQSGKVPLCQRFINYEKTVINFSNDNKIQKLQPRQNYETSTPNKFDLPKFPINESVDDSLSNLNYSPCHVVSAKRTNLIREPIFKSPRQIKSPPNVNIFGSGASKNSFNPMTPINRNYFDVKQELFPTTFKERSSIRNTTITKPPNLDANPFRNLSNPKPTLKPSFPILKSPILVPQLDNLEVPSSMENDALSFEGSYIGKTALNSCNKVECENSSPNEVLNNLEENDLRRIIVAKKRKSMDLDGETVEAKKIKTYKLDETTMVGPKKKVSFNLHPERFSDIVSLEAFSVNGESNAYNEEMEDTAAEELQNIISPSKRTVRWYVVTDTNVLIEEFEFLDSFVKLDPKCQLCIPSRVVSDTIAFSRGECKERRLVTLARQVLRRLATPYPHITVEPSNPVDIRTRMSTSDAILHCCLNKMEEDAHVILITNNDDIMVKAKILKIECFDTQQIKDGMVKKPEVHFDIKKIKISITNVPDNSNTTPEVQTNSTNKNSFDNNLDFSFQDKSFNVQTQFSSHNAPASKPEWSHRQTTEKAFTPNSSKSSPFQIQNLTNSLKPQSTPNKQVFKNVSNSNEAASRYLQNKPVVKNQTENKNNQNSENVTKIDKDRRISSIFKSANDRFKRTVSRPESVFEMDDVQLPQQSQRNRSIFEIDGIEKIERRAQNKPPVFDDNIKSQTVQKSSIFNNEKQTRAVQLSKSIFEIDQHPGINTLTNSSLSKREKYKNNEIQKTSIFDSEKYKSKEARTKPSIFNNEKYKNKEARTKPSIFNNEKYKNKEAPTKPHIFNNEKHQNREAQTKSSIFELDKKTEKPVLPNETKKVYLEDYLKSFCSKNKVDEEVVSDKREELICSFKQVMEECLSHVLQQSSHVHKSTPPWTLQEALQCMLKVYDKQTNLRTSVITLDRLLKSNDMAPGDVMMIIGCGLLLLRHLKNMKATSSEVISDADYSLNVILQSVVQPNLYVDAQPLKTPAFCRSDIDSEDHNNRRNFVKRRSEVIQYLKKHFLAWTNYDETLEDAKSQATWGQNYKDVKVLRTLGKDLNLLKIDQSKSMSIEENVKDKRENTQENVIIKRNMNIDDDNNNKTDLKLSRNIINNNTTKIVDNTPKNLIKNGPVLKVTRTVENKRKTNAQTDIQIKTLNDADIKKTVPKVIRLFNNIDINKEQRHTTNIKNTEKPILDLDFVTTGHTFGTSEAGPKVVRNIQRIDAFEKKLNMRRDSLDLDRLDYSDLSKSDDDDDDDESNHRNDEQCFVKENEYDTYTKSSGNNKELSKDHFVTSDDKSSKYDLKFETNSYATNNDSRSMSLDNCVSNDIYSINDTLNDTQKYGAFVYNGNLPTNDRNLPTNDETLPTNGNNFSSDYVSYVKNCDDYASIKDFQGANYVDLEKNDCPSNDSYQKAQKDDTTNDSGIENESMQAYSLVKTFLCEINGSFKLVHKFIEESANEVRSSNLMDCRRKLLHSKANATLEQIAKIIVKLKSIVKRESGDGIPLKTLLAGAGSQASGDKRVTKYKQIVTHCLGQAEKLHRALTLMLCMTDGKKRRRL